MPLPRLHVAAAAARTVADNQDGEQLRSKVATLVPETPGWTTPSWHISRQRSDVDLRSPCRRLLGEVCGPNSNGGLTRSTRLTPPSERVAGHTRVVSWPGDDAGVRSATVRRK